MDKPKILIVEDDLDLAEMLNAYFRVQNYDVLTAAWGRDALDISQDVNLSLVVLDIRLPDIDGYEVCRQLRLQRRTHNVPVIFLTEKRDRVDKLQGLELGVVDYITKPFDIQELRLRVRNAIARVARQASTNPVTDLPENDLIEEKLTELLSAPESWALLLIGLTRLSDFREEYGFVAADDVLRAVTLMIRNAVREYGREEDFIGHLGPEEFIIISAPEKIEQIRERIETRIRQSREYFYPLKDRERARSAQGESHLRLRTAVLEGKADSFASTEAIREALYARVVTE